MKHFFLSSKRDIEENKSHFVWVLVAALAGLSLAVFRSYEQYEIGKNFIYSIATGNFNAFFNIVFLLLCSSVPYVLLVAASMHIVAFFVVGYGTICLASYLLWRAAMIAIAVSTFHGLLLLFLFVLPVFLVNLYLVAFALFRLNFKLTRTCRGFPRRSGYPFKRAFLCVKNYLFAAVLFNFLWWLVLTIVFVLIY